MMRRILAAAVVAFGGLSGSVAFAQNMTLTSAEVADGATIKDANGNSANLFGAVRQLSLSLVLEES